MAFIKFTVEKELPLNMYSLCEYSRHLQERVLSISTTSSAYNGYRILCLGFGRPIPNEEHKMYVGRLKAQNRAYLSRPGRKWRYPISRSDILSLLNNPPNNCTNFDWNTFLTLGWTFLLRRNEILRCQPSDLTYLKGKGIKTGWRLGVKNNKTSTNKNEERHIFFPEGDIPVDLLAILHSISTATTELMTTLPNASDIIKHLRANLVYDQDHYEVVIHSLRHGRPEDLSKNLNYDDRKIMKVGRWDSSGGAKAYKHS